MNKKDRKLNKKFLFSILIVFAVIFIFAINLLSTKLTERFSGLTFDLTENNLYELSESTINLVKEINKPVNIKVLAKEEDFLKPTKYNVQANEIFKSFAKNSSNVTLNYIDYISDPTFSMSYPNISMKHGDILVTCGENYTLIPTEDLFNYTPNISGGLMIESSRAESAVSEAILKVMNDKLVKVAFTTGHIEKEVNAFSNILTSNNYEIFQINLITEDIADDIEVLFIIAPENDFGENELKKLDKFLNNNNKFGKTVFYFTDATRPVLTNLESFLKEWGIAINQGLVFETDEKRVYEYQPFYPIVDYVDEEYKNMLNSSTVPVLMPIAKALETTFEFKGNYSTRVLTEYGKTAGIRPSDTTKDFKIEDTQKWGPFPSAILSTYNVENGSDKSQVVVISSTEMLSEYLINSPALSNGDYVLNLVNSLSNKEQIINVQPKVMAGTSLGISQNTADTIGIIFTAVLPAIILIVGLAVWLRRRNK